MTDARTAAGTRSGVLVTGGQGFLGRAVVPALAAAGWRVTVADLASGDAAAESVAVDLTDRDAAKRALAPWRWDAVVNLAGPLPNPDSSWTARHEVIARHVNIALNVCAAIPRDWSGRLLHASSMTVYGLPQQLPVSESHPRNPVDAYGSAKCLAEDVCMAHAQATATNVTMLRFPGLFSEARSAGALFQFVRAALEGGPIRISAAVPTAWEILHVRDAAAAIVGVLAAQAASSGAVNVGYGTPMSLPSVALDLAARFGVEVESTLDVDHPEFCLDIARLRSMIPWPPASLKDRITEFAAALGAGSVSAAR